MRGDDGACKMWEEEEGKMVSGESGGMGLHGVTDGVGGDTKHSLGGNLCNSSAPTALMSKEHCKKDGRSLHWRVEIQAQVQREPLTWTPSVLEAFLFSSSCLAFEHSAKDHRSMQDVSRSCQN